MARFHPLFNGAVHSWPDKPLLDPCRYLVHPLMSLLIVSPEDHLGLIELRQHYCVIIEANLLFVCPLINKDVLLVQDLSRLMLISKLRNDMQRLGVIYSHI